MDVHTQGGDPPNQKACKRGTWSGRMVVGLKKVSHRTWPNLAALLAYTMALLNVLAQWNGLQLDDDGTIHLSIADFVL